LRDPTDVLPPNTSTIGRLLRLPLRAIPNGAVLPILAGPSRGMKWIAGSGPSSNWLGLNEVNKRRRFAREVRPGQVVYDIGANVGSYTLLAARLVGPSGAVVSVEPLPENLRYLERHVEINGLHNVRIIPAAATDRVGTLRFQGTSDRVTSHIAPDGDVIVDGTTVDALVANPDLRAPDFLKIDVEGAEAGVLRGATETLAAHRPTIFLATHGDAVFEECRGLLDGADYVVEPIPELPGEFIALPRCTEPV
jgi:FkbM family methyltransferase